jgi:hypothetical protein
MARYPHSPFLCSISTRGFRMQIAIRPVRKDDLAARPKLREGYNAFYGRLGETALPSEVTRMTWSRFFDPYEPVDASQHDRYRSDLLLFARLFTVSEARAKGLVAR